MLLWSDIEGSTQLLERLATSMSSSLQGTSACGDPRLSDLGAESPIPSPVRLHTVWGSLASSS
jgi:hypothetical protein